VNKKEQNRLNRLLDEYQKLFHMEEWDIDIKFEELGRTEDDWKVAGKSDANARYVYATIYIDPSVSEYDARLILTHEFFHIVTSGLNYAVKNQIIKHEVARGRRDLAWEIYKFQEEPVLQRLSSVFLGLLNQVNATKMKPSP